MPTDGILTFRLNVAETVPAVAFTCATPAMEPRVANAEAFPLLSVVAITLLSMTPPAVRTCQLTAAPGTMLPPESVTWILKSEGQRLSRSAGLIIALGDLDGARRTRGNGER